MPLPWLRNARWSGNGTVGGKRAARLIAGRHPPRQLDLLAAQQDRGRIEHRVQRARAPRATTPPSATSAQALPCSAPTARKSSAAPSDEAGRAGPGRGIAPGYRFGFATGDSSAQPRGARSAARRRASPPPRGRGDLCRAPRRPRRRRCTPSSSASGVMQDAVRRARAAPRCLTSSGRTKSRPRSSARALAAWTSASAARGEAPRYDARGALRVNCASAEHVVEQLLVDVHLLGERLHARGRRSAPTTRAPARRRPAVGARASRFSSARRRVAHRAA